MKFFKSYSFFVQVWTNRIKVTDVDSGRSIERTPKQDFSNIRNVNADFIQFEENLRMAIYHFDKRKRFKLSSRIVFQQMERAEGGLCQIIKRAYIDSAAHAGSNQAAVIDDMRPRSLAEIRMIFESKHRFNEEF